MQQYTCVSQEEEEDRRIGFLYGAVDQDKPNVELAIAILQLGKGKHYSFSG